MLFRTQGPDVIAISQPMHAWVAGQLLKDLERGAGRAGTACRRAA
jgi:hypothetical protein